MIRIGSCPAATLRTGDDGFDEIRRDVGVVIALAHVELDCHLLIRYLRIVHHRDTLNHLR